MAKTECLTCISKYVCRARVTYFERDPDKCPDYQDDSTGQKRRRRKRYS